MKLVRLLGIIGVLALLVGGCSNKGSKIVAKVGDKEITVGEVERTFERAQKDFAFLGEDLEAKKQFLQEVINKELLAQEARSRDLDKDDRVARTHKKARRQLLLSKLYEDEIVKKTKVTDRDIQEELEKLEEERFIYQIKVPTEDEAQEIVELLEEGANFQELARDRSVLPSAEGGGLDGWGWRGKYATPFEEAAFSIEVGGFSDVVKTAAGYHVIHVSDVRTTDLGTVEENRARLEEKVQENKYKARERQFMESLKSKYDLKFHDENISFLYEKISEQGDPSGSPYLPKFLGLGDENKVLVDYDGGEVTIADYIKRFTDDPPMFRMTVQSVEHLTSLVNGIAIDRLLDMEVERRGYLRKDGVEDQLNRKLEELMVTALYEDEIASAVMVTDDEVKEYYEAHADEYYMPEMVNVHFFTFPRKSDAEEYYQALQAGASYDSLRRVGLQNRIMQDGNTRGLVPRGQFPEFDDIFFSMEAGDVVGPVHTDEGYKVFQLTERTAEAPMDWERAKPYADKRLKGEKAEEILHVWLGDLKEKWGVEIYEENLDLVSLTPDKG